MIPAYHEGIKIYLSEKGYDNGFIIYEYPPLRRSQILKLETKGCENTVSTYLVSFQLNTTLLGDKLVST